MNGDEVFKALGQMNGIEFPVTEERSHSQTICERSQPYSMQKRFRCWKPGEVLSAIEPANIFYYRNPKDVPGMTKHEEISTSKVSEEKLKKKI